MSGKALARIRIVRASGDRHRYHQAKRNAYTGVRAKWHDVDAASGKTALSGEAGHVKVLRGDYANDKDAKRAAAAEMARIKRGAGTFELSLAEGRGDVLPETPAELAGWKPDIDAIEWIVSKATHTMSGDGGWTTQVELENKATVSDHPAADEDDQGDDGEPEAQAA